MEFLWTILAKIELICQQTQVSGANPCSGVPERMTGGWWGGLAMYIISESNNCVDRSNNLSNHYKINKIFNQQVQLFTDERCSSVEIPLLCWNWQINQYINCGPAKQVPVSLACRWGKWCNNCYNYSQRRHFWPISLLYFVNWVIRSGQEY